MNTDVRQAAAGRRIPHGGRYADQPFLLRADDGAWLCALTTSPGHEGVRGQHVETFRSRDRGVSWEGPTRVEPEAAPENSYSVLLKAPGGRIFIFYNFNTENRREVLTCDGPPHRRVDSLGDYVFKFSDDHGRSWSPRHYRIPVRAFRCDLENPYGGAVRFFWNVGKPFVRDGAAYVPLSKVGRMSWSGFFGQSEGALLRSDNLLTASSPDDIRWETLPEGEVGLRAPAGGGPVAEEHSYVPLSDGTIYAVWRTLAGHPACARSFDGGRTWTPPDGQRFADGRPMKNPRAANFVWKCANGKYLYWFHHHGGRFIPAVAVGESHDNGISLRGLRSPYDDRNPAWLCGGREVSAPDGRRTIAWSQPEIALYEDDPLFVRMSYPDLLEDEGKIYLSETNKLEARIHELPVGLTDGLWGQFTGTPPPDDAVAEAGDLAPGAALELPLLPSFSARNKERFGVGSVPVRAGVTLEARVDFTGARPGDVLADSRQGGVGMALRLDADGELEWFMSDGRFDCAAPADPGTAAAGGIRHVVAHVDAGPRLVWFTVDGRVSDGGDERQFGWRRFPAGLWNITGGPLRLAPRFGGRLLRLRVWDRALSVSEAVALHRAARSDA